MQPSIFCYVPQGLLDLLIGQEAEIHDGYIVIHKPRTPLTHALMARAGLSNYW